MKQYEEKHIETGTTTNLKLAINVIASFPVLRGDSVLITGDIQNLKSMINCNLYVW